MSRNFSSIENGLFNVVDSVVGFAANVAETAAYIAKHPKMAIPVLTMILASCSQMVEGNTPIISNGDHTGQPSESAEAGTENSTLAVPTSTSEIVSAPVSVEWLTTEFIDKNLTSKENGNLFDKFKQNEELNNLFKDPSKVVYSEWGMEVTGADGKELIYIFYNAYSPEENIGYIASIQAGNKPGEIGYVVLNRRIGPDGNLGLALEQDLHGIELPNAQMYFTTGLSEHEIASLTEEELAAREFFFIPGGLTVPVDKIRAAKVFMAPEITLHIPEAAPTPPVPAPELGDKIVTAAQEFFGPGFEIGTRGEVKDITTGLNIPGFTIKMSEDGKSWEWQRVYPYLDNPNFTVTGTDKDIKPFGKDGLDMYAWTYENGEFQREKLKLVGVNGVEVETEPQTVQEFFAEVMANSTTNLDLQLDTSSLARKMLKTLLRSTEKEDGFHIEVKGAELINKNTGYVAQNYVPTMGLDGKWDINPTSEWVIKALSTDNPDTYGDIAIGAWYGEDDGGEVRVIVGDYLADSKYLSDYWETHDPNDGVGLNRPSSE